MVTTSKRLSKSIKDIIVSSEKTKKLAQTELEKIDAKYKALAEKEKSSLNQTIKFIDSQLAFYNNMLKEETAEMEEAEEVEETEAVTETVSEEEVIHDTLFEENNESEQEEEEKEEDNGTVAPFVPSSVDTASSIEQAEPVAPAGFPADATDDFPADDATSEDDGWPEMPEEWK